MQLQAKLLRVLQQREVERVGGSRPIPIDFRLVAATNRNLDQAMREGRFRQDLFYRLNVINLQTPALRERPEDVLPLANHFAALNAAKCGRKLPGIAPEAAKLLRNYDWPGNVRELENAMERAIVLGLADSIRPEDLPEAIREPQTPDGTGGMLQEAVNTAKREVGRRVFEPRGGDRCDATRIVMAVFHLFLQSRSVHSGPLDYRQR